MHYRASGGQANQVARPGGNVCVECLYVLHMMDSAQPEQITFTDNLVRFDVGRQPLERSKRPYRGIDDSSPSNWVPDTEVEGGNRKRIRRRR